MNRAYCVAGLGFGDEGKGGVTDYLVRQTGAKLVVRYNGAAQASHNVHTADGRHHAFSQFGSGTFAAEDVQTYLSRFMLIEPYAMLNEAMALGGRRYLSRLIMEEGCPVITPFHWIANRLKEAKRGSARHGSCGFGVGELRADQIEGRTVITVADLEHYDLVRRKLERIRDEKLAQLSGEFGENIFCAESIPNIANDYRGLVREVRIVVDGALRHYTKGPVVFEGAQGMLLDEKHGFAPYNTWTDITFGNALKLLEGTELEPLRIGVLRTYFTRHGAGPFPSQDSFLDNPDDNTTGEWQGEFRQGSFDIPMAKYALSCIGGVDVLALTHLDRVNNGRFECVRSYRVDGRKVDEVATLSTEQLMAAAIGSVCFPCPEVLAEELGVPLGIKSSGPMAEQKEEVGDWTTKAMELVR